MLAAQVGFFHAGTTLAMSASRRCSPYDVVSYTKLEGHRWVFDDRVYDVKVRGLSCIGAHAQIHRADHALSKRGAGFGVFIRVEGWRCTSYRPFTGNAGFVHWDHVCERPRGRQLTWSERTLRSRQL